MPASFHYWIIRRLRSLLPRNLHDARCPAMRELCTILLCFFLVLIHLISPHNSNPTSPLQTEDQCPAIHLFMCVPWHVPCVPCVDCAPNPNIDRPIH